MKETTGIRLKKIMTARNLKQVDILKMCEPYCRKYNVKLEKNDLSQYVNDKVQPKQDKLSILAMALNVSEVWLMGFDVPMNYESNNDDSDIINFFNNLMESHNSDNKEIDEVRKIIEKETDSKTAKAIKMYDLFLKAPAHIQSAVESLLKGSQ